MKNTKRPTRRSLEQLVRRRAIRAVHRMRSETVLSCVGPTCETEWEEVREIIAEEMWKLESPNAVYAANGQPIQPGEKGAQ